MVHVDVWEAIIRKNDSVFVRSLLGLIWGKENLRNKCLCEKRANKDNTGERKTKLTPEKRQLVKDLLYEKITSSGVDAHSRNVRMAKLSRTMTLTISDERIKAKS
ncbi:uncharacterized protein LOC122504055 [Leptopilina heterotoma]|uniref:uncharacterized protein LOC122504055 n=1 Tax=Leptopilina heterotoma TaxID=63436 RepID=UPI001CA7F461|nr:uncharacterized protein LOC122504055 [Leptopilina heterotoma]